MSQSSSRHTSFSAHPCSRVTDGPTRPQANGRADAVVVPRRSTLDGFINEVSQADGIRLIDVDALTTLVVQTENSVYHITILRPHAREVLVQGGMFFTVRTRACLSGSSFGGSCLKLGWVGVGLRMEFHAEDQWVITSHVRSIAVERVGYLPVCSDATPILLRATHRNEPHPCSGEPTHAASNILHPDCDVNSGGVSSYGPPGGVISWRASGT